MLSQKGDNVGPGTDGEEHSHEPAEQIVPLATTAPESVTVQPNGDSIAARAGAKPDSPSPNNSTTNQDCMGMGSQVEPTQPVATGADTGQSAAEPQTSLNTAREASGVQPVCDDWELGPPSQGTVRLQRIDAPGSQTCVSPPVEIKAEVLYSVLSALFEGMGGGGAEAMLLDSLGENHVKVVRKMRNKQQHQDGYKWRKYGQKALRHTLADGPKSRDYFRCTSPGCAAKKQIEYSGEGIIVSVRSSDHTCQGQVQAKPVRKVMMTLPT